MPEVTVDGEKWYKFDLDEVSATTAEDIERAAGITWLDFVVGLRETSPRSWRALAWIVQREQNPDLAYEDVEFRMKDFTIRDGDEAVPLTEASEGSDDATASSSTSSTESNPGNGTG